MDSSTVPPRDAGPAKSPPTRRAMDVLETLADSPVGRTSAELAKICGISTSTCALVLAELERRTWVTRRDDRRYALGSGLFGLVHGLRAQFPLLDRGRDALGFLHTTLGAACSMSKIGQTHLTNVDAVGHGTDGEHAVGQRFPIGPPFGLVAMAWRDDEAVDGWLRRVTPRLTQADITAHRRVLAEIRQRGYGAWRFDSAHNSLHDRLTAVLASLEPTAQVTRELSTLMTMVTLESVTKVLETEVASTEFVVLPIFGRDGQPEYQIEIRLGGRDDSGDRKRGAAGRSGSPPSALTLAELDAALGHAQTLLRPGVA
jgi:DNA-binding IclR family transcriptional regulator